MAVNTATNKATYSTGSSVTEFQLAVKCFADTDVKVYLKNTATGATVLLESGTDYTPTAITGDFANGVLITTTATYDAGYTITLLRDVPATQILELTEGGDLPAEELEDALDRNTMISQQLAERLDRSIQFPASDPSTSVYTVSDSVARRGKALGFNPSTGALTELSISVEGGAFTAVDESAGITASGGTISGKVDGSTIEFSSGNIALKDAGVTAAKLASTLDLSSKTVTLPAASVTKANIENVANMKVLGNVSGSASAPAEVAILDEDNMASDSATGIPTQQSVKAYADTKVSGDFFSGDNQDLTTKGFQVLPGGLIIQWGSSTVAGDSSDAVTFDKEFPNACLQAVASGGSAVGAGDGGATAYSLLKTGMTIGNGWSTSLTIRWIAIGH